MIRNLCLFCIDHLSSLFDISKIDLRGKRKDQLLYTTSVLKSNLPNDPNLALLASNPTKRELHITLIPHNVLYTSSWGISEQSVVSVNKLFRHPIKINNATNQSIFLFFTNCHVPNKKEEIQHST